MYSPHDIKLYTVLHIKSSHSNFEDIMNANRLYKTHLIQTQEKMLKSDCFSKYILHFFALNIITTIVRFKLYNKG